MKFYCHFNTRAVHKLCVQYEIFELMIYLNLLRYQNFSHKKEEAQLDAFVVNSNRTLYVKF
jgi:hypothetical protein